MVSPVKRLHVARVVMLTSDVARSHFVQAFQVKLEKRENDVKAEAAEPRIPPS